MDILEKIQPVFREIFDDNEMIITEQTTAGDIEEWDSFAQMQIVLAVEAMFSIKFTADEVTEFRNVGDIVRAVKEHIF